MQNTVLDCIMKRRTVRSYKSTPLSKEQVEALVNSALISPSAMNRQPWHVTAVTNQELILKLEKSIVKHFQENGPEAIAERIEERNNKIFYNAPLVFFISVAQEDGLMDVGIVAQSINIAAKSMGLGSATLGLPQVSFLGQEGEAWKTRFHFPKGYEYGIGVAVGYGAVEPPQRDPDRSKVSYIE